jgi:hypothetical protein
VPSPLGHSSSEEEIAVRQIIRLGFVVALLAAIFAPAAALAQEATPPADATPVAAGAIGPAVGTDVPYYGQDGVKIGTVSVDEIVEPFKEYDGFTSPQRGYHFAVVTVTVTNTGSRPFDLSPSDFIAVDSDGFIASSTYVERGEATATQPDFEYIDALAPGDTASGVVAFEIFSESGIEQVIFWPDFDRLIPIVNLRSEPVVAGDPVSVLDGDGNEMVQVTINGLADPFEGYDQTYAPPRGSRYIMLDVTVANTGPRTLTISPSDFILTDDQGFVIQSAFVSQADQTVPDFPYMDLEPGQEQRGVIVYQLLSGVPVTNVYFGNLYDRLTVLADLSEGAPDLPAGGLPPEDDTGIEDDPAVQATPVASSPECEGLVDWAIGLVGRLTTAGFAVEPLNQDVSLLDAETVRGIADQLTALAEEQANSNPPPAAEELNTFMTERFFQALANATTNLADALESNNPVTALLAQAEAEAVTALFDEGGEADALLQSIEEACPQEIQQLEAGG